MNQRILFILALLLGTVCNESWADGDSFYEIRLDALTLTEGKFPGQVAHRYTQRMSMLNDALVPYVVLDGPGEVFITNGASRANIRARNPNGLLLNVQVPHGTDVSGRLFISEPDAKAMRILRFKILASTAKPDSKGFLQAKKRYYENLVRRRVAGGAWFRHQMRRADLAMDKAPAAVDTPIRPARRGRNELASTFALFSGSRAISENLQLDRLLTPGTAKEATIALTDLKGITVDPIDWAPLLKGINGKPASDPLARYIPADQHALFFPSFKGMLDVFDEATINGTPVLRMMEPRVEDALTRERYERQLCLPTDKLVRVLGPSLITSVAMTGSDPYLRSGTDVAFLFEAKFGKALAIALSAKHAMARTADASVKPVTGKVGGIDYTGVRSPDRSVCSYLAAWDNVVVVSNSLVQLEKIIAARNGKNMAALDEYTFFRSRYRLGAAAETALLIITDEAIRRWCSAKWRIAASRRIRAAAILSELQAQLQSGQIDKDSLSADAQPKIALDLGELTFVSGKVIAEKYGSLEFATPIAEMSFTKVTEPEARQYRWFRDRYQRNWRQFFDPIAVRFQVTPKALKTDVTVMPLIASSEYRQFIEFVKGGEIAPRAGDPHSDALIRCAIALDLKANVAQQMTGMLAMTGQNFGVDPFGWIGKSATFYIDSDPIWKQMAAAENAEEFMEKNWSRMPLALDIEVSSPMKVTMFLATARAYIEQTAPGMTLWKTLTDNKQPYVKIAPSEEARADMGDEFGDVNIYYAVTARSLLLTLNEELLKRKLDRQAVSRKAKAEGKKAPMSGRNWIGKSFGFQLMGKGLSLMVSMFDEQYQMMMQSRCWSNLPILNEWKRRYPKKDPVAVHKEFWQTKLVCPGGGNYVWNDKWQTMASTVYGHPGAPKAGPAVPAALKNFVSANFGVTFEHEGLRARAELHRKPILPQ